MNSFDLSLYLITDTAQCGARGVVDTAVAAVRGGATIVQLRDPAARTRDLVATARALVAALRPYDVPLIVNDRVDVAIAAEAAGVHVGQNDMAPADVRRLIGPRAILGLSVGSLDELAVSDLGPVDYVGIGPVHGTATKADAGAAIGPEGFRVVRDRLPLPAVAIGGISAERTEALIRVGASGVAVVSALCAVADPFGAAREFTGRIKAARA